MSTPITVRSRGGPFDVVYIIGSNRMGFITLEPGQRRLVNNVAPAIRVGGSAEYNSDAFSQIVLYNFAHGGDLELYESGEERYHWQDGKVAMWRKRRITLNAQWHSSDATQVATARQIVDFVPDLATKAYVCAGVGTKLRIYDANTPGWTTEQPSAGAFADDAVYLFSNDEYLFVACGTGDDFWRWDGVSGTGWAQPAAAVKATCFGWYQDTLYRGYGNQIISASNNNGSAWSATPIDVGYPTTDVTDLMEHAGYLIIAKPEGIYTYDGTDVNQIVDATVTRATSNYRGFTSWRGALYYPWLASTYKGVVRSVRDITAEDFTPEMQGDEAKEEFDHGTPLQLVGGPSLLYCAFDDGEGVYPEVLAYTGIGWHQMYRGASGATMNAIGYSALMNWLLINDGTTRYMNVRNAGKAPYPDYATSGVVALPALDAGYPDEMKAWRDITLEVEDASSDNTVLVEYDADGAGWVEAGTISTEQKTTLTLGGLNAQISAKKMAFRLTLTRDAADVTTTPRVKLPIVIRTLPTMSPIYAYSETLDVYAAQALRNNYGLVGDVYTFDEMLDWVSMLATTSQTVIREDELGRRARVKITDHGETTDRTDDAAHKRKLVTLRMQEMFSGFQRQMETTINTSLSMAITLSDWAGSSAYGTRRYGLFAYGA